METTSLQVPGQSYSGMDASEIDEIGMRRQELQKELEAATRAANFHAVQATRQRALGRAAFAALCELDRVEPSQVFDPASEPASAPQPPDHFGR